MEGSVYSIIEIVGASSKSWEDAGEVAVETAWPRTKDAPAEPTSGWPRASRRSWRFADRPSAEPEHPEVERPG